MNSEVKRSSQTCNSQSPFLSSPKVMLYIFSSPGFPKSFPKCYMMSIKTKYNLDLLNILTHAQHRLFKASIKGGSWPRPPPSISFCIQELTRAPLVPHTLQASLLQH